MAIIIVGLGPGSGKHLTLEAWQVLSEADTTPIYFRTLDHPTIKALPDGLNIESFDALYRNSADFETVYKQIITTIIDLGRSGDVIYAVPGSPFVGEAAVAEISRMAQQEAIACRIVEGLSFIEPTLTALRLDGIDGLQIFDAMTVGQYSHPPINADSPLLLAQVYSQFMAGELKLALMAIYPPETLVSLVHDAGTEAELVEVVPLFEIDRSERIKNLTCLYVPATPQVSGLPQFAESIAYLRGPNGCPWDQEQTHQSMRDGLLEEAAEVLDAIDRDEMDDLCEELGDLLLHIVFQAQLASEAGDFTLTDVIVGIDAKIKRRHPHVWGDVSAETADQVTVNWDAIKAREKGDAAPKSIVDNIPPALSALARSQKIQKRVRKVGFDWPSVDGVFEKVYEEIDEIKAAETPEELSAEIGDLLFVTVNLAKWHGVDAEIALRETNLRFMDRFKMVETLLEQQSKTFGEMDITGLEELWQAAKKLVG